MVRGDKEEVSPSNEVPPPFCCSSWSGREVKKPMASTMGEEGPQRRASMSSRPNCEFVVIMVIVAVVGHKRSVRRGQDSFELFFAVECSSGEGFHEGPEDRERNEEIVVRLVTLVL